MDRLLILFMLTAGCESGDNPFFVEGSEADTEPAQADTGPDAGPDVPDESVSHVGVRAHVSDLPGAAGKLVVDLFVDRTEMTYREARTYGQDWLTPGHEDDPALVTFRGARQRANARSRRDGFVECYIGHTGGSLIPAIDCNGWRLPTLSEHTALVGDALAPRPMAIIDEEIAGCYRQLESRRICYNCTCPDGPRPAGHSNPNNLGLQDMIGNVSEWVESPSINVSRYPDLGIAAGGSWSSDYWVLTDSQSWFMSNDHDTHGTFAGVRLVRAQ